MLKVIAHTALSVVSLLMFTLWAEPSRAVNPNSEWHEIHTEHFTIIFDSRHYQLAKDFARHAETAWLTLVPVLRTWPDKTIVVIDDSGDQANGMATGFPFPQIHLFPAPPTPGETIADSGPWNLELVTHEYTHVLNFQPAHGLFHTLRNLFGSIVRPNLMLPRWYLEGLAVEMETRFSPSGGRLRSRDFTAIPRAMVQDGTLRREDIARIGETSIPDWPGGARPYLFGGLLWEKLARENLSFVGDLNDHYARRMPFFIETPLIERTSLDWQGYLDSLYTEIENRSGAQIEEICEGGCFEGTKLGESGFFSRSPVLARPPDAKGAAGALAYLAREHNHDSVLMIVDRAAGGEWDFTTAIRAVEPTGANRVAWFPDGKSLLYDGIDDVGRYENRSDLWVYDRGTKKKSRLSKGLRAREPDVSLAGTDVAFVQITPGKTRIAMAPFVRPPSGSPSLGVARVLYVPPGDNRVSWPTFVGRNTLVFVERSADGKEVLKVLEVREGTASAAAPRTVATAGNVTFPRLVIDTSGRKHLLFASNVSGVTNLYLSDLPVEPAAQAVREWLRDFKLSDIRPITNSVTRAWNGDFDSQSGKLIYTRLDGDGSHLRISTPDDRSLNQALITGKLAQIPLLIERTEPKHAVPEVSLPPEQLAAHDMNVWPYLLPRYWMPYAAFVPGGAFLSATTSAGDPLGRHLVAASVSTDTRIGKPNFFGTYVNHTSDVEYTLMADDFWQRLSSSGLDRRSTTGDLSGRFYVPGLSNSWMAQIGFSHQRTEIPSSTTTTDVRIKGGPRVGMLWQDLSQKGFEISPEKGGFVRLAYSRFLPTFGNLVYDKTDLFSTLYASQASHPRLLGWLPERHVVSAALSVSWLPGLGPLLLGPSSVSLPIETVALGASSTSFVMRGYPSGSFLARKLARGSFEYRFPLSATYHGFGTTAAFIRRWHAAVFADVMTIEGAYYDFEQTRYRLSDVGTFFTAAGVEARLDSTLFYHLPVQFIFGLHMGFDTRANPNGAYPVISISL